jgi:thiamine transporter
MSHDRVRAMVEAALMLALAYALDNFVPPFYRFPQGGSIDLSMLPILVYCLRWGPKWSLSCCFVNGVLQYFLGGGIAISWQSMLLDYVVAYTLVFTCGFAAGKKLGWLWGPIIATPGRWLSLTLSGALLWYMYMPESFLGLPMTNAWVYSALFNGVFCLLVLAVDLVALGLLQSVPAVRKQILKKQN